MLRHSQTHYAVEDSVHLGCVTLSFAGQLPTFRRTVVLIRNACNCSPIKTQRNIPEELNPEQLRCQDLKPRPTLL